MPNPEGKQDFIDDSIERQLGLARENAQRMKKELSDFIGNIGKQGSSEDALQWLRPRLEALANTEKNIGLLEQGKQPVIAEYESGRREQFVQFAAEAKQRTIEMKRAFDEEELRYQLGQISPQEFYAVRQSRGEKYAALEAELDERSQGVSADDAIMKETYRDLADALAPNPPLSRKRGGVPKEFLEYREYLESQVDELVQSYHAVLDKYHDHEATRDQVHQLLSAKHDFYVRELQRIKDDPWQLHNGIMIDQMKDFLAKALTPKESLPEEEDLKMDKEVVAYEEGVQRIMAEVSMLQSAFEKAAAKGVTEEKINFLYDGLDDAQERVQKLDEVYLGKQVAVARSHERKTLVTYIDRLRKQYPRHIEVEIPGLTSVRSLHRAVRAQYVSVQHTLDVEQRRAVRAKLAKLSGLVRQAEDDQWRELFAPRASEPHTPVFAAMVSARRVAPIITAVVAPHFKLTY